MKTHPALALVEFSDIPTAVRATDAMIKRAPVAALRCGTITAGRWLTIIGGTTASVEEALAAGRIEGGPAVVGEVLLPDVHPRLYEAIAGVRRPPPAGALAVVETDTVVATVRAAEAALKGTGVELVEIRLADTGLAGKGVAVYGGELHEVEAAMALARAAAGPSGHLSVTIVAAPHPSLVEAIAGSTVLTAATLLDLGGEG